MSSGMDFFLGMGVILGIAIYLNYRMSRRSKRHAIDYEATVIKFDQAVDRKDWSEIERLGRDLLYSTSVTLTVVNKIEAISNELAPNFPEFEVLKNEVMNKKLRWNALDDFARAPEAPF